MIRKKKKSWFYSFTEPFEHFYLGFLASVGLAFGSLMIINILRELIELYLGFEILIYSRIVFSIFYLSFLIYTYKFLDMKKHKSFRNGFVLFTIIYIVGQIFVWIKF